MFSINRCAAVLQPTAVVLALLSAGCSGRSSPGEPVAECTQYESTFTSCFHRPLDPATHESFVPKSSADRDRLRQLCGENLQRLQASCR
jgi:hypothetical protein